MKTRIHIFILLIVIFIFYGCSPINQKSSTSVNDGNGSDSLSNFFSLRITYVHPNPVITVKSKGAEDIKFGFEGGRVVKLNGTYHLFTSELYQLPIWVKMRLGYWVSQDKVNWTRVSTIRESSGDYTGKDSRASLWSPLPVWDDEKNEWNLFYVAYKAAPDTPDKFLSNHEGRIWRAVSKIKGLNGISGPYDDVSIILEPGIDSQKWEGLQGVDSFFPWRIGTTWYAFYGSAKTETSPIEYWRVGFALSSKIAGPWKRLPDNNPSKIEKTFIENPIVTKVRGNGWLVVYDNEPDRAFGWAYSSNGINWPKGNSLIIDSTKNFWCKNVRTPMGLIDEGNGKYTMFYSGCDAIPDWKKLMKGNDKSTLAISYIELEIHNP